MPESVDELKRLSPQERIKRLKELEEERKKEIEQAEELIKETVREIADAEEKKRIPIPQAKATDLSSALATSEEKELVATHHLLAAEGTAATTAITAATATAPSSQQQQKSLEEVATEEAREQQNLFAEKGLSKTQQMQGLQKPEYAIGTEQQRPAFGEYLSKSQQAVTGGTPPSSSELEKITEIYKDRAVTGAEAGDAQQKYFGTHQQVTGGYEMAKREQEEKKEQSDFYRRKAGGPA
ncbi:hypothetical protein HYV85_01400 [Candidatus Woesearchaeota archaeon]|nr:hypothetical protein [Candidatus Woesearchaeota archaeon]